jgi:hypothetical protein
MPGEGNSIVFFDLFADIGYHVAGRVSIKAAGSEMKERSEPGISGDGMNLARVDFSLSSCKIYAFIYTGTVLELYYLNLPRKPGRAYITINNKR